MNKPKNIMRLLLTGLILFAMIGPALAGSYYVSTDGDNSNSGTSMNNAFGTVAYGSSQLEAGDTLYIGGGTYWNDKVNIERSGTANNWITVTNYNGEKVKMYHDEEFNEETMIYLVDRSYIKIENIESSHYGSAVYISGKYRGLTHDITIINVDSLSSFCRGYACNAGAHDMIFKDILIKDVEHPTSSPNGFDFLTSPHNAEREPHDDFMIYNIYCENVDVDYVESHNGFNFGQGTRPNDGNWESHWETKLCDNFQFVGCDVYDAKGAGYYTNKYVLHNSIIDDCTVTGCYNGLGLAGNDLLIKDVTSHDHGGNSLFILWDTPSYEVVLENFDGDPEPSLTSGCDEIESDSKSSDKEESEDVDESESNKESEEETEDTDAWKKEWYGVDSDEGEQISTKEYQEAVHHWLEDIPVRGHVLTTTDIQEICVDWLNEPGTKSKALDWRDEWTGEDTEEGELISRDEMQDAINKYLEKIPVREHTITKEEIHELMGRWRKQE